MKLIKTLFRRLANFFLNLAPLAVLLILLTGSVIATGISLAIIKSGQNPDFHLWVSNWLQNIGTGLLGSLITYLLLESIIGHRKEKINVQRQMEDRIAEVERRRLEQQIVAIYELKSSQSNVAKQNILNKMRDLDLLRGATLSNLDLSEMDLSEARLTNARFVNVSFVNANLQHAQLDYSYFEKTRLIGASLKNTNLNMAEMVDVDMTDCTLRDAQIVAADMSMVILRGARLQGVNLRASNLSRADLSLANFEQAILIDTDLSRANLSATRMFGAKLTSANLRGATFNSLTTLPDGTAWAETRDLALFTNQSL